MADGHLHWAQPGAGAQWGGQHPGMPAPFSAEAQPGGGWAPQYPPASAGGLAPTHGGPAGADTASSFLRDARSQLLQPPAQPDPSAQAAGWQAQLRQHLERGRGQPPPQAPPGNGFGGVFGGASPQPPPQPGFHQGPRGGPPDDHSAIGGDAGGAVESTLLTEDEFQSSSAVEFGAGIAMSGCTIDGHLRDGDTMPRLEPLSNSVCLRITPTAIVFLHQYDRNFILEVPIGELYEITEDTEQKVVLLHTRNANGSALIQLSCHSQRKRIGIYKTLCIRKNALERLKRQQQQITRQYYSHQG
eukprot:TRINITY_DN14757_c0_g1_i1.p1 TRINITY_DN14757_c0_g1~~TRINITY_DN14757_c0_g1_i1.p1  ORF type:complete len:338 (+),score=80.91 TRINITY_DN14757_c0_g1_i1:113-1015(+)